MTKSALIPIKMAKQILSRNPSVQFMATMMAGTDARTKRILRVENTVNVRDLEEQNITSADAVKAINADWRAVDSMTLCVS